MRNFKVVFEVFRNDGHKENKAVTVEAGSKKLAAIRGMSEINKISGYSNLYKNVVKIEEVTL